jgi:UDP-N-acetylglucosamine diphosphorylase / glucose-1-phosphate thymidylyltransferase / UDP-N-acetylgalactosamine diphosphorylase / glucosamine-1-phosphate N-acetyltransferase / galactosamine-1-phosphate N-acetyltransferase
MLEANIVLLLSGIGKRFLDSGYSIPKPYLDIHGVPMFKLALDSVKISGNIYIIVRKEHYEMRNVRELLSFHYPYAKIIIANNPDLGQANNVLIAEKYINTNRPLIICNCDHKIIWDYWILDHKFHFEDFHAAILSFYSKNPEPKYSYVEIDETTGKITNAKEKVKISDFATAGIYCFRNGRDYVQYAKNMIKNGQKINNEYYVVPVIDRMIKDNKNVCNIICDEFYSFGTPEDLSNYYKNTYKKFEGNYEY